MDFKKTKLLVTIWLIYFSSIANADDIFEIGNKLTTPTSVVLARKGSEAECLRLYRFDTCQLLEVNGKPIISEYYVSIEAALPSKFDANVIFAQGSSGGNACCAYNYLIDISTSQPLIVKVTALPKPFNEKPVISIFDEGFTYEGYGDDKGEYGEMLWKVYRYKYGSGRIEILKSSTKYSFTELEKKTYPDEILDDPVIRKPVIKVMGKNNFLKMRKRIAVQGLLEKYSPGIYTGQGCMPHSCGSEEGIFVLDSLKKQAWAMYIFNENGQIRGAFFGSLVDANGIVRQILDRWLSNNKITWSQINAVNINNDSNRSSKGPISGGLPPLSPQKK